MVLLRFLQRKSLLIVSWLLVIMSGMFCPPLYGATFPEAPQHPKILEMHGDQRQDPYFWLREKENPAVLDYLKAENNYLEKNLAHTRPLQQRLTAELRSRLQEEDLSLPIQKKGNFYYSRTVKGKEYPLFCRKQGSLQGPEEVLLDMNQLQREGGTMLKLGALRVSPNQRYLAYTLDINGSESYTLYIKDLQTGKTLPQTRRGINPALEWAEDNETLYYITLDATKRPAKLQRGNINQDPQQDQLLYEEEDQAFFLGLSKTSSERYILVQLQSKDTSEIRYLGAKDPKGPLRTLRHREKGVEYGAEHRGDHFYVLTNYGASNFKLLQVPIGATDFSQGEELLPERQQVVLEDFQVFEDYLAVQERVKGLSQIRIMNLQNQQSHSLSFPEPTYQVSLLEKDDYTGGQMRFRYSSPVSPDAIYDYDMERQTKLLRKQLQVPGYRAADYTCERIWAKAPDGTAIPISLVYKKGLRLDGNNPMLLTAYGSYGYNYPANFNAHRLSLLDRGFICAIAHIRGGQEMGPQWYEQGKLLQKKNTFTDFIACAEHLIAQKYTNPHRLAITGGSAGGMLMGAVANLRPDLFEVVVAQVPFVDVLNTMMDPSLPLTVTEYDEWGNPQDKKYYDYIKSYSPYDQVKPQAYPHMLVTAGLHDPRVGYWEPAKWVAKLRDCNTGQKAIFLKTNLGGGHFGAGGRYAQLEEVAFTYVFVLDRLGLALRD